MQAVQHDCLIAAAKRMLHDHHMRKMYWPAMLPLQEGMQLSKDAVFVASLQVHQCQVPVQMQKRALSLHAEEPHCSLFGGNDGMPVLQGKKYQNCSVSIAHGSEALGRVLKTPH